MISPEVRTHCERCKKPLTVSEMIEQWCLTCEEPARKDQQQRKAA